MSQEVFLSNVTLIDILLIYLMVSPSKSQENYQTYETLKCYNHFDIFFKFYVKCLELIIISLTPERNGKDLTILC